MPNLVADLPVEIFLWVFASTSGLTRMETGAVTPLDRATCDRASSSGSLSTLKQRMPAFSASPISSRVLPTPEKTMRSPGTPAARARISSPEETMSMPRAEAGEGGDDRLVGIGLQRVAQQHVAAGERLHEHAIVPLQRGRGVAIEGRAHLGGEGREIDVLGT